MEEFKDTGYASQDMRFSQDKVGTIIVNTLYFSNGGEYDVDVKIFDAKDRCPHTFGNVIFQGNLASLIKRIQNESNK